MNVAVGLFGISYLEKNVNWLRHWLVYDIDFKKSVDNYQKYIFTHLKDEGYNVDTFISTYKSEDLGDLDIQLNNAYSPKSLSICDYKISTKTNNLSRNIIFSRLCHNILNSNTNYDFVILTRLDLNFLQKLSSVRIDLSKINVVHETDALNEFDDNFYIIPGGMFKEFVEVTNKYGMGGYDFQSEWHINGNDDCLSFHYILPQLKEVFGNECINTMIDGKYMAGHSPFMNLVRGYHHKPDFNDVSEIVWQGLEEQNKDYFKS